MPLEADIKKLTSQIESKFSKGIAFTDELPRLRELLKLQIVGAEILGDALPVANSHRGAAFGIAIPEINVAILKARRDLSAPDDT